MTMTSHCREQPGNQMAGFDCAMVGALGAGRRLHAGDRRGRGELHAEQVSRTCRRGGLGRVGRAVMAGACRSMRTRPADSTRARLNSVVPTRAASIPMATSTGIVSIGHSIDGDSQQIAVGAMLVNGDGSSWELAAQSAKVNRAERRTRFIRWPRWRPKSAPRTCTIAGYCWAVTSNWASATRTGIRAP